MGDISAALQWMIDQAQDPYVGYSQDFRNGAAHSYDSVGGTFTYASNYQRDWAGISHSQTIKYYDCSSAIYYALKEGGYDVEGAYGSSAWTTGDMVPALKKLGFTAVTGNTLQAGDICVSPGSHALMITDACKKGSLNCVHAKGRNQNKQYTPLVSQFRMDYASASSFNNYLRDENSKPIEPVTKDINMAVVAAIAGNFVWESSINPGQWETGTGQEKTWTALNIGYGLGQWTNTDGDHKGRLYQLYRWLIKNNWKIYSGNGQVDYIFHENVWHTGKDWQKAWGISSLEEFLELTTTDTDWLAECWANCWEGIQPSSTSMENRKTYAKKYLEYIPEHKDDADITKWAYDTGSPGYLTESQMENNAVLLYRRIYDNFNEYGYSSDTDDEVGDSGDPGVNTETVDGQESAVKYDVVTETELNFESLLYAMLGSHGSRTQIHIIRKRR